MNYKALLFLTVLSCLATVQVSGQGRETVDMNQNWSFLLGDPENAQDVDFEDSKWEITDVPHDWSIHFDFDENIPYGKRTGYLPKGTGWYRKEIIFSRKDLTRQLELIFDGIYMNSDIWLNGHHLGHYVNGYNPIHVTLNKFATKGKNILAVRVDNSLQPNSRWYTGSGIYRNVRLEKKDPIHIGRYGVIITTPEITLQEATINVTSNINFKDPTQKNLLLRSTILRNDGTIEAMEESKVIMNNDNTATVSQIIRVTSPKLWSPETPELYQLKTEIINGKKVIDNLTTNFGIRSLGFSAEEGFILNGKQVKMNGVNLHHDGGAMGAAVPVQIWERRLKTLKEMGCNAIRTAHNPAAPEFMDLCDSMGFLVMDEAFDEWMEPKGWGDNMVTHGYHQYFEEVGEDDLRTFVRRDRNHPSVVMWSIGNEVPDQSTVRGVEIAKRLIEICHEEDPTRPVTQGCDMIEMDGDSRARIDFLEALDIVGYNYVDRWRNRRELYFTLDKMKHPGWKMIGTESSSINAVRGEYPIGDHPGKIIAEYNRNMINIAEMWKYVAMHDFVMGDFMWTGIDYLGEAWWPIITRDFGVIDRAGFPKDAYYFYKSIWTEEPMVHLFPHWNWEGREGQILPVVVYSNCDTVELFVNGKSYGEKIRSFPRQGMVGSWGNYGGPQIKPTTADLHLSWDVPYEKGKIVAVGKNGSGKQVFAERITAGKAARIKLEADKKTAHWEKDIIHLTVKVLDENGVIVPNADNRIFFEVEGPGKIIAVDNGDPKDYEKFTSTNRRAFHGYCLGILQTDGEKGNVSITATSPGLSSGQVLIETR